MELFKEGTRAVTESGADHPLFECLPEHVGEKADQNVRFDPSGLVMPDRADRKIALVNAERRLRFSELNVGLPEILGRPVLDVRAKDVTALAGAQPVIPFRSDAPRETQPRRHSRVIIDAHRVASCRASIPFEEPADLSLDAAAIERVARTDHPVAETLESFFDSFGEALMDRFLFLNPFVRAAQHERLRSVRTEADTHLHSFAR